MFIACGILVESFTHICQDELCQGEFTSQDGNKVWYGAISDGCSRTQGSHLGAKYLVKEFALQTEALYNSGLRGEQLLRQVALKLTEKMAEYRWQDEHSELVSYNGNVICSEVFATLQGYIADHERVLLLLAGDGYIAINGNVQPLGGTYPVWHLAYPKEEWEAKLSHTYAFVDMPTERVNSLMLATDGLEISQTLSDLLDKPQSFVEEVKKEATMALYPKHRTDDTGMLVLARTSGKTANPLPANAAEKVRQLTEQRTAGNIYADAGNPEKIVARQQDQNYWRKTFDKHYDHLAGNNDVGVMTFGITAPQRQPVLPKVSVAKALPEAYAFLPLTRYCDYDSRLKVRFGLSGLGPRHICEILLRLRETLTALHKRGEYAGSLRPQDVEVKFNLLTKDEAGDFTDPGLKHLHNKFLRAEVRLVKPKQLDPNFVHPELWNKVRQIRTDKQAQFQNDCYQFAVLAWWLLSGADPFGEGIPADDSHNRIYRMAHNHYYWNTASKVLIPTDRLQFLKVAQGRWGYNLHADIQQVLNFKTPSLLSAEEMSLIRDHGFRCKNKGGEKPGEGCTLYVHPDTQRCPFCGLKFV